MVFVSAVADFLLFLDGDGLLFCEGFVVVAIGTSGFSFPTFGSCTICFVALVLKIDQIMFDKNKSVV